MFDKQLAISDVSMCNTRSRKLRGHWLQARGAELRGPHLRNGCFTLSFSDTPLALDAKRFGSKSSLMSQSSPAALSCGSLRALLSQHARDTVTNSLHTTEL